jgi:hypothetical protein
MKGLRVVCLAVAIGAVSAVSLGQERPAPPAQPAPQQQQTPGARPPPQGQQTPGGQTRGAAPAPAQAPPATAPGKVSDEEFIPTEELSADEEVTFPIDI